MRTFLRPGIQALRTMDSKAPMHPDNQIPEGMAKEQIAAHSGLDFKIGETSALMMDPRSGVLRTVPERKILFREDTRQPLSIVGADYQVAQPEQILSTFDTFADVAGFRIAAAGSVKGGKRIWAMAETGEAFTLKGGDTLGGYLYMATACDTTMSTTGFFTSIAASCWNQLQRMWSEAQDSGMFIKIPHNQEFNVSDIQKKMTLSRDSWNIFTEQAKAMAERKVNDREATEFLIKVLAKYDDTKNVEENVLELADSRNVARVLDLYKGKAMGSEMESRNGTAWGLVNAVTEFMDHHRNSRSAENRFVSATMGDSFNRKSIAFNEALKLAA